MFCPNISIIGQKELSLQLAVQLLCTANGKQVLGRSQVASLLSVQLPIRVHVTDPEDPAASDLLKDSPRQPFDASFAHASTLSNDRQE